MTHVNLPYAIYGSCLRYILKCFIKPILSCLQGNVSSGENLAKHNSTGWILLMLHLPLLLVFYFLFFAILLAACPLLSIKHSSSHLDAGNLFIFPGFYLPPLLTTGAGLSKLPLFNLPLQVSHFQQCSERAQRKGRGKKAVLFPFIETPAQINGNYHSKSIITGL